MHLRSSKSKLRFCRKKTIFKRCVNNFHSDMSSSQSSILWVFLCTGEEASILDNFLRRTTPLSELSPPTWNHKNKSKNCWPSKKENEFSYFSSVRSKSRLQPNTLLLWEIKVANTWLHYKIERKCIHGLKKVWHEVTTHGQWHFWLSGLWYWMVGNVQFHHISLLLPSSFAAWAFLAKAVHYWLIDYTSIVYTNHQIFKFSIYQIQNITRYLATPSSKRRRYVVGSSTSSPLTFFSLKKKVLSIYFIYKKWLTT